MKEEAAEYCDERLCRQLSRIKVSRIIRCTSFSVPSHFSVKETVAVLRRHRVCAAPVVDDAGRILGVVTLGEINRLIADLTVPGASGTLRAESPTL